jgi:hypothetical protein
MAAAIPVWAARIQLRLRPSFRVSQGMGIWSTRGAHTNLNEYPNAAQEKKVTADRSTPASLSHKDKEEKINKRGMPAEKPKKSMVITRG